MRRSHKTFSIGVVAAVDSQKDSVSDRFMPAAPPIMPEKIVQHVIRVARRDGMMVLAIAGAFAIVSALGASPVGAAVGIVIAGAGVFELHGAALLRSRRLNGVRWLVGSQF